MHQAAGPGPARLVPGLGRDEAGAAVLPASTRRVFKSCNVDLSPDLTAQETDDTLRDMPDLSKEFYEESEEEEEEVEEEECWDRIEPAALPAVCIRPVST